MDDDDLRELLAGNLEHPRWDDVAERCLTCGNCTMVCPTCFCTTVEDTTDLAGDDGRARRRWDSCFTLDFSYIHGGSVRPSARSRYRQWMTHKLGDLVDQFGTSGCVGCGRCITWCPVGIDITEEVAAIRGDAREAHDATSLTSCSPDVRSSTGLDRAQLAAASPAARSNVRFDAGEISSARASRPTVLPDPPRARRARDLRARRAARVTIETLEAGEVVGWSWLFPPYRWHFDARALDARARDRARRRVPARQVRARPGARLRADEALRAGAGRAAAGDAPPAARRLWRPRRAELAAGAGPDGAAAVPRRATACAETGRHLDARRWSRSRATALAFAPGQFNMLYVFGVGEVPISISGDPAGRRCSCTRCAPSARSPRRSARPSRATCSACAGPSAPPGRSTAAAGSDVVIVAGGIGLAPLRPALYHVLAQRERYGEVVLLYGARTPGRPALPPRARALARGSHRGRGDRRRRRAPTGTAGRRRAEARFRRARFDPARDGRVRLRARGHDALHRRRRCSSAASRRSGSISRWSAT